MLHKAFLNLFVSEYIEESNIEKDKRKKKKKKNKKDTVELLNIFRFLAIYLKRHAKN